MNEDESKYCKECGLSLLIEKKDNNVSSQVIKFFIDNVAIFGRFKDVKGSIIVTENYILFIKESNISRFQPEWLAVHGGMIGVGIGFIFESIYKKMTSKTINTELFNEQELLKASGDKNVKMEDILSIQFKRANIFDKFLCIFDISLHTKTKKHNFGTIGIPEKFRNECKNKGMNNTEITRHYQAELANSLYKFTGIKVEIK